MPLPIIKGVVWQSEVGRLDELAANDVKAGKFANSRDAAKAYFVAYCGKAAETYSAEQRNFRLRDIARRIAHKVDTIE